MVEAKVTPPWSGTAGQLVLEGLLKQAGPTKDQLRTQSVLDGWIRFVEGNAEKILWLRGRRFEDQAELLLDAGVELVGLIRRTVDAHLRRAAVNRVVEKTLVTGGVDANQARIARECLMKSIAPLREQVVTTKPRVVKK